MKVMDMFDGMIRQLENTADSLYEPVVCRTFLLQAYQESIAVSQQAAASGLSELAAPLLDRFHMLDRDVILASTDRYFSGQKALRERLANLEKDMQDFDQHQFQKAETIERSA